MPQDKYAYDQQALDNLKIQNPPKRYDQACYDLALKFLPENQFSDEDRSQLAASLQDYIEDFIECAQDRAAGYDPRNDPLDHDYSMNG